MMTVILVGIALSVGTCIGFFLAAIAVAAREADPIIRTRRPDTDPVGSPMRPGSKEKQP